MIVLQHQAAANQPWHDVMQFPNESVARRYCKARGNMRGARLVRRTVLEEVLPELAGA